MRSRLFFAPKLAFTLLAVTLVACDGGDGSSCVLDSDCASFGHACIEGMCRAPGASPEAGPPPMDAGERRDASEPMDSGSMVSLDSSVADAMPTDSMILDATSTDGMVSEAGTPTCETLGMDWMLMLVSPAATCGGAANGGEVTITPIDGMPCSFTVSSPGDRAIRGTLTLGSDNLVSAMLSVGGGGPEACSGRYTPTSASFNILCGDTCVMDVIQT